MLRGKPTSVSPADCSHGPYELRPLLAADGLCRAVFIACNSLLRRTVGKRKDGRKNFLADERKRPREAGEAVGRARKCDRFLCRGPRSSLPALAAGDACCHDLRAPKGGNAALVDDSEAVINDGDVPIEVVIGRLMHADTDGAGCVGCPPKARARESLVVPKQGYSLPNVPRTRGASGSPFFVTRPMVKPATKISPSPPMIQNFILSRQMAGAFGSAMP